MKILNLILLVLVLLLISASATDSPDTVGLVLDGRVADSTDAVIPSATIELLSLDGRVLITTESDQVGNFRLNGLHPGTYDLRVTFRGFKSQTQRVSIAEGCNLHATVTLKGAGVHESVTVTAEAAYVEPNATSGTRINLPLRDVPQSIGVVNSELIRSQAVLSLPEAVRNIPGVNVHLGEGRRDQVLIRGFSALNDEFIDGVRDDSPYFRDLSNVDRIEVVKGPASVLYGRGSSGGVINRVTKSPLPEGALAEFSMIGGSYGTKRTNADFGMPIIDRKLTFRVTGAYEDSGSFRHEFGLNRFTLAPSLLWKPSDSTDFVFQSDNLYDDRIPDRGIPSLNGRPAPVDRATYYGDPEGDFLRNKVYGQTFRFEHRMQDWTLRNTLRHTSYRTSFSNTQPNGVVLDGSEILVTRQQYSSRSQQGNYFNQAEAVTTRRLLSVRHTILIGTELGLQSRDTIRFIGTAPPVALDNPVLARPVFGTAAATDNVFNGTVGGIYAQDLLDLGRGFKALVGGRFDYYRQSLDDRTASAIDLARTDRQFSPRAGLVYQPAAWVSLYGNFSRSFQPSGEGLSLAANAAELKPETSDNFEVGSKFDFFGGRFASTVSVFRLNRNNVKTTDPANPTKLLPIGLQRTNGLEISLSGRLLRRLEVFGGYALLDARTIKSTSVSSGVPLAGRRAALVPRNSFNMWSTYSFANGFGFGGGVVYNDDRFVEANNLVALPSYTRVDATVFYRKRHYDVALNLRNVANVTYYESAHSNFQIMPGAPISGLVTTRFRW